jgi:hypothetical protein
MRFLRLRCRHSLPRCMTGLPPGTPLPGNLTRAASGAVKADFSLLPTAYCLRIICTVTGFLWKFVHKPLIFKPNRTIIVI